MAHAKSISSPGAWQDTAPAQLDPNVIWDAQRAMPGLTVNPYTDLPAGESGHKVMFGEWGDRGEVVVKPHRLFDRASQEARQIGNVARLGLNTPELQAVVIGNKASYLVTSKYPGLQTLTGMAWNLGVADKALQRRAVPAMRNAATGLAVIHGKGAVHGDYQAKNVAKGPKDEQVVIDLEKVRVNMWGEKGADDRAKDLYLLASSLLIRGLLADRSPSYRTGFIAEHVVLPYAHAAQSNTNTPASLDKLSKAVEHTANTGKIITLTRAAKK